MEIVVNHNGKEVVCREGKDYYPSLRTALMGRSVGKSMVTEELMRAIAGDEVPMMSWNVKFDIPMPYGPLQAAIYGVMGEVKPPPSGGNALWVQRVFPGPLVVCDKMEWVEGYFGGGHYRKIPARRFAGLYSYRIDPEYLKEPQPSHGVAWEVFRKETTWYRDNSPIYPYSEHKTGNVYVISYTAFGGRDDGLSLSPSERRAKYSSTMDGNGKPRARRK
jgi:hypothetical protein